MGRQRDESFSSDAGMEGVPKLTGVGFDPDPEPSGKAIEPQSPDVVHELQDGRPSKLARYGMIFVARRWIFKEFLLPLPGPNVFSAQIPVCICPLQVNNHPA